MTRLQQALAVLVVALFAGGGLLGLEGPDPSGPTSAHDGPDAALPEEVRSDGAVPEEVLMEEVSSSVDEVVFEENRGQFAPEVRFAARIAGGWAAFKDGAIVLMDDAGQEVVLDLQGDAVPVGLEPMGRVNHFRGPSEDWVVDAGRYQQVLYQGLQEGVDVLVYAAEGSIEFDHIVAPGADPAWAAFEVHGADPVVQDGELVLGEDLRLRAPYAYQEGLLGQEAVPVAYEVDGRSVGYALGTYDPARPLVIDPIAKYSSHMGLSGGEDALTGIEVMADPGNPDVRWVFVAGHIVNNGYPPGLSGTTTSGPSGNGDWAIARFSFDLRTRTLTSDWFTYVGSTGFDHLTDMDLDVNGNMAVVGYTSAAGFPLLNELSYITDTGLRYTGSGPLGFDDFLVGSLDANGALTYATYMGTERPDEAYAVAWLPGGLIGIGGYSQATLSTGFPTLNAIQPMPTSLKDGIAGVLDPTATPSVPRWATYLGGSVDENIYGVGALGTDLVAVGSGSPGYLTTPGAFMAAPPSPASGVITRIDIGGGLVASTYMGGEKSTQLRGVHADGTGGIWIGGHTSAPDFPMCPDDCVSTAPNSIQPIHAGSQDQVVFRMDGMLSEVQWSTFYGQGSSDYGHGFDFDSGMGHIAIGGQMWGGTGYPYVNPAIGTFNGIHTNFVVFDTVLNTVRIADTIGGTSSSLDEDLHALALDDQGNVYIAAASQPGWPITLNAIQPTHGGGSMDGSMAIIGKKPPTPVIEADASAFGHPVETTPLGSPYQVLTLEEILLDGSGTVAGDDPLDLSTRSWELKDAGGTVLATDSNTWTPSFSGFDPLAMPDDGLYEVCLSVEDTSGGPYDHNGTACMELEWLNRPPVAGFFGTVPTVAVGEELDFSDASFDLDGSVVSWAWDFGDGGTDTVSGPSHSWSSSGVYTVELTVTDDDGATDTTSLDVTVLDAPVADFTYSGPLVVKEAVDFQDQSVAGSRALEKWTWDFGDGSAPVEYSSASASVAHTYGEPGMYAVTLTVFDGAVEASVTKEVEVVQPTRPMPDWYSTVVAQDLVVSAAKGLLANDGHPEGALRITSYTDAGPGDLEVEEDGSFVYSPPVGFVGNVFFTYNVTDGEEELGPVDVEVEVRSALPPVADFGFVVSGDMVLFEDRSQVGDHGLVEWAWVFSDGSTASMQDPGHVFLPGHHSATLTVMDEAGLSAWVTRSFHVAAGATPVHAAPVQGEVGPGVVAEAEDAAPSGAAVNRAPTAVATAPLDAVAGDQVRLDGSRSSDPDEDALSFQWRQVGGPPVGIMGADGEVASFVAPSRGGVVVFELEVFDGLVVDVAQVEVVVLGREAPAFEVRVLEDGSYLFGSEAEGSWSLGDGVTASGSSVTHRYAQPGTYTVRLEVDGVESVQLVRVLSGEVPDASVVEPAVDADPEVDRTAAVPDPRVPTAVAATAAGVGLLILLVWVYRTWALVWIRVFTRVGKPELLDHPLRSQIHDVVHERPGVLLPDLVELLGKSRRTVLHHMGMLEGAGMLSIDRSGRFVALHPAGLASNGPSREAILRSPVAQRLLKAAAATPGATVSDLARRLGVSQPTVSYHVARLESADLVRKVKEGSATRLFPLAQADA